MKLIHPDVVSPIIDEVHTFNEWIIEAPELFLIYVQELFYQLDGQSGNFILFENDKELSISKYVEIIIDPFTIDINNKKNINKLYAELSQIAYEEKNYLHTQEILSIIHKYFIDLEQSSDYMLHVDSETDITSIFKILNIQFEYFTNDLCGKISQYIKIMAELMRKKIFVLVNIRSYLSEEQLDEIIKIAKYNEIYVLLIEDHQNNSLIKDKNYIIIDKDGCEIC